MTVCFPIIAHHRSPLSQKFGAPRQPNLVSLHSQIHLLAPYDDWQAFMGLDAFSHIWVLWQFHHNKTQSHFAPKVRPPRLGGNTKTGVFATRSMYRPAPIGLSVVGLDKITHQNQRQVVLHITGADFIDGTPILDIKPYLPYSDSITHAKSPIHAPKPKTVQLSPRAKSTLDTLIQNKTLNPDDSAHIQDLIAQDPRVAYRQNTQKPHTMRYKNIDVVFFLHELHSLYIDDIYLVSS